ncbi:MAG TPA: DNA-binding response regulator, partial [Casimicrobiaceae bacterium]|nr:DNA-binding response regulator [Casimicrobiaceae bacterium]
MSPTKLTPAARAAEKGPLVYLVDDDEAIRDSLGLLLRSVGLDCAVYASALEFLGAYDPARH